jgi:hypothetical protein
MKKSHLALSLLSGLSSYAIQEQLKQLKKGVHNPSYLSMCFSTTTLLDAFIENAPSGSVSETGLLIMATL